MEVVENNRIVVVVVVEEVVELVEVVEAYINVEHHTHFVSLR